MSDLQTKEIYELKRKQIMKQQMFTAPTIDAALDELRDLGALITPAIRAAAKDPKFGVILGKFTPNPKCKDGFRIGLTPVECIPMLMAEHPDSKPYWHTYTVFVCTGAKNENELIKGLGL